jgi:DNA topoisomerase-1
VNKFLTEHFAHWVDYEYTAKLEDELDDISNGKDEWVPMLESSGRIFPPRSTRRSRSRART